MSTSAFDPTLDPTTWHEDPAASAARDRLQPTSPHTEKRRLYPFSCRLPWKSGVYPTIPKGHVFMYARTKQAPALYPIEVLHWDTGGLRQAIVWATGEVEMLTAQD